MLELLQKLGLKPDAERRLIVVLQVARDAHDWRRDAKHEGARPSSDRELSRSTLLYSAAAVTPLLRTQLEEAGLDWAGFVRSLGLADWKPKARRSFQERPVTEAVQMALVESRTSLSEFPEFTPEVLAFAIVDAAARQPAAGRLGELLEAHGCDLSAAAGLLRKAAMLPRFDSSAESPPESEPAPPSKEAAPPISILPATTGDQKSAEDHLGFKPYVDALHAFLTHDETTPPLTLSIEGAWGSGKSSFMEQLRLKLRGEGKLTVEFNAWRHDKQDELWAAFALAFLEQVRDQRGRWDRLMARWLLFKRRFNWSESFPDLLWTIGRLTLLVLLVGLALESSPGALQAAEKAAESLDWSALISAITMPVASVGGTVLAALSFLRNPLDVDLDKHLARPDYAGRAAFIESFHADFEQIVRTTAGDATVYVFIDDLDRCDVPRAADLMQAINLMISESPQLVFILGIDRERIAAGVCAKYSKVLPFLVSVPDGHDRPEPRRALEFGYEFIEKFVQVAFRVPRPSAANLDAFLDGLSPSVEAATAHGPRSLAGEPAPASPENLDASAGSTSPAALAEPGSKGSAEVREGERQQMRLELGLDSAAFRSIVKAMAPSLDSNPRRLKQFINLFRLQSFIASETGLFGNPGGSSDGPELNLVKIAKFVTIAVKWPLFLEDVRQLPGLLEALKPGGGQDPTESEYPEVRRWSQRPDVLTLLMLVPRGSPLEGSGLTDTDVRWLMKTTPSLAPVAPPTEPDSEPRDGKERALWDAGQAPP